MSNLPVNMTAASLIILRYLKENNDFNQFVQLSEKGLPLSEKEIGNLINYLEKDGLLIKGPSGEYHINDIQIKGKHCARITVKGERFIDDNDSSFKGNKITELIGAALGLMNFLRSI
jgi:hypothetical protein